MWSEKTLPKVSVSSAGVGFGVAVRVIAIWFTCVSLSGRGRLSARLRYRGSEGQCPFARPVPRPAKGWTTLATRGSSQGSARPRPRTLIPFGKLCGVGCVVVAVDDKCGAAGCGQGVDHREAVRMGGRRLMALPGCRSVRLPDGRNPPGRWCRGGTAAGRHARPRRGAARPGRRFGCGRTGLPSPGCQTRGLKTPGRPAMRRPPIVVTRRPRSPGAWSGCRRPPRFPCHGCRGSI